METILKKEAHDCGRMKGLKGFQPKYWYVRLVDLKQWFGSSFENFFNLKFTTRWSFSRRDLFRSALQLKWSCIASCFQSIAYPLCRFLHFHLLWKLCGFFSHMKVRPFLIYKITKLPLPRGPVTIITNPTYRLIKIL